MIKLYTDGATSNNGKDGAVGGWAYIAVNKEEQIFIHDCGFIPGATNNICELTAAIKGCRAVEALQDQVTVYSDSAYIVNCYRDGWYLKWQSNGWRNSRKEPVANRDLWEQLIAYFENPSYTFLKVPAHSGIEYNEIVDKMAVEAKLKGE